jgi:PAS domain S-box-containing protein
LSEDFFFQLAQNTRDIIFHARVTPEFKFDYVSPSCFTITGYTPEEFYADPRLAQKCWHPDDAIDWTRTENTNYTPSGKPKEVRWIRKDGAVIWIEHLMTFNRDKDGKLVSCQIIARDITARKQAEEAYQEHQIFTQSLLEHAPHATVVINPDTSIRYVNPTWEQINGWTLSEVVGVKAPYPWWPKDQEEAFLTAFLGSFNKKSGRGELPSVKKNGEYYWIDITWIAVHKDGKLAYLLVNSIDITERKKAEKALHDSESKFALAFNASPQIMAINRKKDGKFIEINESYVRASGYSREEVLGRNADKLNFWADPSDRLKIQQLMKENGRAYNQECHLKTKSGDIQTLLFSMEQIMIGDEPCYISVSTDITERKKAEAALKESEEKFSKVYNFSPNATCLMTADYKFIEANDSFYRFTGYSKEDIHGRSHIDLALCENTADQIYIGKCFEASGRVFNKKINCRTKSGEIRAGLFSADTIEIGGEKRVIIVITDISEQAKATQALQESEEKFSKAFRDSPEIIAITTLKDGKYLDVNASYCHFTGYTREEVIGKTIAEIKIWANESDREERLKLLNEQGKVTNREYKFRTKSGEIRTWLYSAELLTLGGEPCLISASIDITERKRMENALADEATRRRILIEQSSDGIVILDENGGVYEVNWRFAEMLGYTLEEASQLHIWDWEKDQAPEKLCEQFKNVDSNGGHFTTQHLRKDGTFFDVDVSFNSANFAGQKLVFCVCRDMSERNRMEKALRESEEKFALAFNASPHMIIITDSKSRKYLEVNESFINNTGYTREEIIGKKQADVDLWAYPEESSRMIKHMEERGYIRNEEYQFKNRSGEIRTWLCSADIVSINGERCVLAIGADITERKQAEALLRDSEIKFSRAFNASPISLSISRMGDGKFLEVNESFLRDKGYTRDEIIGWKAKAVNIWANQNEIINFMTMMKTQGRVHNIEMQYLTKDGSLRTGLVSAEHIRLGNEPCMLVLNNDITQQKQAEEQLRLLSSVTKQVTDCTVITDPEMKITYMNQAGLDMFGYTLDEVKGKELSFSNVMPLNEESKKAIRTAINESKIYTSVISKKRKDGSVIICDCRLSPMYDEKGNIVSMIDVQRDITRQKDVEAKLQEHKKLIDSILATMPEGVLVIDSRDRILLANKALYNILHLSRKLTRNKPLSELLPLDQYFNIHRAITSGSDENNTVEFRYNVQDVEKIIYCVIVKMDGERTLITFSDVSREREEEEKLYLTDRLASIGEMAAGLAHELNNPLTGILTLSQILTNSDLPKENKEDVECIYSEAKRAAGIVKNVLLFARNKPDESGQASANEVVKDALRLREYEQRANNIKVVTELEDNLPDVAVDNGQLQQVFLNMISNAEAAIKEAGRPGVLTVTTQRVNNHVNIHFSDNGCGIKKHIMPRIFDPFFTTKEVGKGTGLGLSICYSIIVKHGGKITVKSQVNEGTTFTIKMPIVN